MPPGHDWSSHPDYYERATVVRADLVKAEIDRLRGEVEREGQLREQTADNLVRVLDRANRAENEVEALSEEVEGLAQEIERLRSENEGYATSYDALSAELAAERQRARMPDIPSEKVLSAISGALFNASFLHGSSDVPTDIYEAILHAMGLDNG